MSNPFLAEFEAAVNRGAVSRRLADAWRAAFEVGIDYSPPAIHVGEVLLGDGGPSDVLLRLGYDASPQELIGGSYLAVVLPGELELCALAWRGGLVRPRRLEPIKRKQIHSIGRTIKSVFRVDMKNRACILIDKHLVLRTEPFEKPPNQPEHIRMLGALKEAGFTFI